jgi:hypothetical protein
VPPITAAARAPAIAYLVTRVGRPEPLSNNASKTSPHRHRQRGDEGRSLA